MNLLFTKKEYARGRKRFIKRTKKYGRIKDSDGDRYPDFIDGHPNNPKKHSLLGAVGVGVATGAVSEYIETKMEDKRCPQEVINVCPSKVKPKLVCKRQSQVSKNLDRVNPFMELSRLSRERKLCRSLGKGNGK